VQVEVDFGPAASFVRFDSSSNKFKIIEGTTTEKQIGVYFININLSYKD